MKKLLFPGLLAAFALHAAELPFSRAVHEPDLIRGTRKPVAERVLMYPEIQYKYGLFQNFLGGYIDRPLFFDRATRYKNKFQHITADSFFREIEIMRSYGFDGGGSLALNKNVYAFLNAEPERAGKYYQFPQFAYGESGKFAVDPEKSTHFLEIALKSRFVPKIAGRIPISTYNSDYIEAPAMKKYLAGLKQRFGDTFAVCGGLSVAHTDFQQYFKTGEWDAATRRRYQEKIDSILEIFDGIQVNMDVRRRTLSYMTEPDFGIWDKYLTPMVLAALEKTENKTKLLCGAVLHGYINHMSGVNHGEFGTGRARGILDRLVKLNCDFIFFFEWNEFNENTCWQPTLYNSLVLQRLVKFYAHIMRGEQSTPNPGDNLNIPQFSVSYRDNLKTGEQLQFELLNIPDTNQKAEYTAQLTVRNPAGKILFQFPVERFNRAKMRAVTFAVPTEAFSTETVLLPELSVTGNDGKTLKFGQLQYVRILPTFCYNYKAVRQSLRDLLTPAKVNFTVTAQPDRSYRITAMLDAGESLSSLEVTDAGQPVYAFDKNHEFDRAKNFVLTGAFSTLKNGARPFSVKVADSANWTFREWGFPNVTLGNSWKKNDTEVSGSTLVWSARNRFIMTIPKTDLENAVITVGIDDATQSFKLRDVVGFGEMAHAFPRCRFELRNHLELPDIPFRIDRNSAEFTTNLQSSRAYPVYQLRAVTVSGKIYRSAPVVPRAIPSATEKLNVFSETTGKVAGVPVAGALIPRISWAFNPAAGDVLRNNFNSYFNAELGGGYYYSGVYSSSMLPPAGRNAPEFIQEDGKTLLRFTGSEYLHFPPETFPRGPFVLRLELKPQPDDATKSYVLFRHFSSILGSATVFTKFDRLVFAFGDRYLKTHTFSTPLDLPPGQWSVLEISYDLQKLILKVNEKTTEFDFPAGLALYFKPAIFGGHTKPEFGLPKDTAMFKGLLKSISIDHNITR